MNPLPLAFAELRRHRAGATAVVLLIAAAVAFGIAISSVERALRQSSARASDRFDLLVGAPGSAAQLVLTTVFLQPSPLPLAPEGTLEKLRADAGVAFAEPIALGDFFGAHPVVGTTTTFLMQGGTLAAAEGRLFEGVHEAVVGARAGIAIGAVVKPHHGTAAEQQLAPAGHDFAFTVVGRLQATGTPWDNAVLVPYASFEEMHHHDSGGAPAIVVKPRSVADAYRLRGAWRTGGTQAVFPAEVLAEVYAVLGRIRDFTAIMVWASQALVMCALLLVMVAVVAARRQSNAVLRALGAPPPYVFLVTWLQGFALFAAGTALGLAFGAGLAAALGNLFFDQTGLAIATTLGTPELRQVALQLIAASGIAILPALACLRGNIADDLRG